MRTRPPTSCPGPSSCPPGSRARPVAIRSALSPGPSLRPSPHLCGARSGEPARAVDPVPRHPHHYPRACTHLWISAATGGGYAADHPEHRLVHRVWAELSTVVHRASVGCDIRVIPGATFDHSRDPIARIREISRVFPWRSVDHGFTQPPVDPLPYTATSTSLWITVDEGPSGVDDDPSDGGRHVGTNRPPTGRATYPQLAHRSVHTQFCPLTCTDTGFPPVPQPLRR